METAADGELPIEQVLELEAHLEECGDCRERARFEFARRQSLRNLTLQATAPEALRERIAAAMAEEAVRTPLPVRPVARAARKDSYLPWRVTLPLAAAASFALVWGATSGEPQVAGGKSTPRSKASVAEVISNPVDELIDEFVSLHARPPAPQITEPGMIGRLEPELGIPLRLPMMGRVDTRWEGGSLVPVQASSSQRAASLRYRIGDHRVTIYVYDSGRYPLRARLEPRVIQDLPVYVGTLRGYSIAAAERSGVGYAIASDFDCNRSAQLVAEAVAPSLERH